MLSNQADFNEYLYSSDCPNSVMSSDQIDEVLNPEVLQNEEAISVFRYSISKGVIRVGDSEVLKIVAKDRLFDLFESTHTEGGKHLGRDRLYTVLKQKYNGFSKDVIRVL